MRQRRTDQTGDDAGAVAIIVAVFAVTMLVFAAMVVDLGFARETRREAQNTADAAALAGAGELYDDAGVVQPIKSIAAVKDYAARNFGTNGTDWAGCSTDIPAGWTTTVAGQNTGTSCISYDSATVPKKVQVVMPLRHTPVFFGGVIGYQGSDISALAQAALQPDSTFSCVVCVLSTYEGQNGDLSVTTGGVAINGATTVGPNGSIVGSAVGLAVPPGSNDIKGTVTPAPDSIPPFEDPLTNLPLPGRANFATSTAIWPSLGTAAVNPPANGVCTPVNVYRTVNGCTSMSSGVYVVTQGSKLAGNGDLTGTGVLLFFGCEDSAHKWVLCSSGSVGKQGTIVDAGNGTYTLTSMSTGSYAGLAVVFDPDNTATYSQVGNGQSTLGGGIYGAKVTLDNRGTGAGQHCDDVDPFNDKGCPMAVNGIVVVGKVVFKGGDALKVTYNGSGESLDGPDALRLIR